ncbi:LppA family lipoprotein [Rhodococcus phenolicus]|uniref:LppA family lipoprotein n=1 Tax=Rhodococcus phenolicus TaxID=263849 RepID=UPI00082F57C3|nr:LppA family lipoprotein [Rhodococcus phenolicus]
MRARRLLSVAVLLAAATGCASGPEFRAVPEPVAPTIDGAVEHYLRVQREIADALSAEFPELVFGPSRARLNAGCEMPDGSTGWVAHLPLLLSDHSVPSDVQRAIDVFDRAAARAGFHQHELVPRLAPLFDERRVASDGSSVTFGAGVSTVLGLEVGCYPH